MKEKGQKVLKIYGVIVMILGLISGPVTKHLGLYNPFKPIKDATLPILVVAIIALIVHLITNKDSTKKAIVSIGKLLLVVFDVIGLTFMCYSILYNTTNMSTALIATTFFCILAVIVCIKPFLAEIKPLIQLLKAANFFIILSFAGLMKQVFFATMVVYMILLAINPVVAQIVLISLIFVLVAIEIRRRKQFKAV